MKLQHITFTGIDAKTDIKALTEIQQEFPIAEFGVLTSYHWYENGNRYLNPSFLSNLYAGNGKLNLALHVCGSAAHDAAEGMWCKYLEPEVMIMLAGDKIDTDKFIEDFRNYMKGE